MKIKHLFLMVVLLLLASSVTGQSKISWWQFWTDPAIKPVIEQMVAEFESANPDVEVEVTDLTWANGHEKIVIAFGSGTGPDVVELGSDWIAEFAANGLLEDISDQAAADSSDYHGWGMATYQGKVYARPWILGTRVLFGNRLLLRRLDYDTTFVPVNFDELQTAANRIRRLGGKRYGWGSNAPEKHRLYKKYLPFFWSYGAQIFSDDGRYCVLPSDKAIQALTYYKALHDTCGYVGSQRDIEDAFLDGYIGFIISGDWLLKRIELENRQLDFFTTVIPGPKLPGRSFMGGEFLAVNAASKNKDAAARLIRFVTSSENQVRFCKANRSANPSSIVAQQDEYFQSDVHLQTFIKQLQLSKHPPVDPDWVYIEQAIEEAVERTVFEKVPPAQALLEAQRKIEKIRKE